MLRTIAFTLAATVSAMTIQSADAIDYWTQDGYRPGYQQNYPIVNQYHNSYRSTLPVQSYGNPANLYSTPYSTNYQPSYYGSTIPTAGYNTSFPYIGYVNQNPTACSYNRSCTPYQNYQRPGFAPTYNQYLGY